VRQFVIILFIAGLSVVSGKLAAADFTAKGETIYKEHCISCHGVNGAGVADEYDEALVGTSSIEKLTRVIHKTMPEDEDELVVDEDAKAVAQYIYHAFYSPEAQAKIKPVRKALLRRTKHQHRNSIADLVASFRGHSPIPKQHGLTANYFNAEKMNKQKQKLLTRIEPTPSFNLANNHGVKKINPKAFSIHWQGALLPPETGTYHFRITTPNGARFFLNTYDKKKTALIDAWVSSKNSMRTSVKSTFLIGGHALPMMIEYTSFQEKKSSILIEWKQPHGIWEKIPQRFLAPINAKEVAIINTPFPADDASLGYERGSTISKQWSVASANAAIQASSIILNHLDQLAKTNPKDKQRTTKLLQFCEQFTARAHGRPLTTDQKQRIHKLFKQHGPEGAAQRSLMLALTSPYFLYPELSHHTDGNQTKHDAWAIATHLALTIWDSVPDNQLRQAASKGHLVNPQQVSAQAQRMLRDPRAHHKLRRFFHEWLNLSEKEDLRKDPKLFPGFNARLIADLRSSLNLFVANVLWSKNSDYRKLFLTQEVYMNPRIATFYKTKLPVHLKNEQFTPVVTPDRHRAGILTHPYVLSAFSYHKQTSPIHRGVYLSRNVLGRFLKPPPKATEFKDSDFKPNQTMREKVTELTKDHSCMACHEIINPIGFSLENYDAVGRFRTREKNKPINTESDYITDDDRKVRIKGAQDLAQLAIESPGAHRAFIKHLFHHLIQQPVPAYGYSTMDRLHESFKTTNFNMRQLIVDITTTTVLIPSHPKKK